MYTGIKFKEKTMYERCTSIVAKQHKFWHNGTMATGCIDWEFGFSLHVRHPNSGGMLMVDSTLKKPET